MLVENSKFQTGDIINLKLISGDEVVGELVTKNNSTLELKNPCLVVTSPDGIGLIQAMFGLDPEKETLTYKDQHIITTCFTHVKMREHYITITSATV
jgi:hypothetical protein